MLRPRRPRTPCAGGVPLIFQAQFVMNYPTRPYDPDVPDKYRIDPHAGVIPFDWSVRDG